jgi:archaellum component FlaC
MSLFDAFKKREEGEVPDVSDMLRQGMSEQDIIDNLRQQGYDSTAIKNALVNATIAAGNQINNPPAPVTQSSAQESTAQSSNFSINQGPVQFTPPQVQNSSVTQRSDPQKSSGLSGQALDTIQQVLEQIIEEKWQASSADLNSVKNGLKATDTSVDAIDDRLNKLNQRIDSIQNAILGKTEEYNKTLSDVNIELQAFEKVIDRLIPTISDSIKELRDLIDDLKKTKA